jgi:hypothetical protein
MNRKTVAAGLLALGLSATPAAAQHAGHGAHHGHSAPAATDTAARERSRPAPVRRGATPDTTARDSTRRHPAQPHPVHHGGTASLDAPPALPGLLPASLAVVERESGGAPRNPAPAGEHRMLSAGFGSGWTVTGMAQAFPILTAGEPTREDSPLRDTEAYLTQPAVMVNVASPGQRLVLRTTLNFEAETQRGGEYTFGGWGEGFIDKRHPHTFLHEAMLSLNLWDAPGGALSLSAGKGFAAYGTDDPMSRPVVKYPTNHHLSQVLERWTVNAAYLHRSGLGLEASVFGGAEPTSPSDLGNIESFGDSWSVRASQRFGGGFGPFSPWEVSASYARVEETHHEETAVTHLMNAALRHEREYGFGKVYGLLEASRSEPKGAAEGYYAVLGEAQLGLGRGGRHRPYLRVEYATRPEYERAGEPGSDGHYQYDHDAHPIGSTRWLVSTVGYDYGAAAFPLAVRPFVEAQHNRVSGHRGDVDPAALFGRTSFWSTSVGFRVFLGGSSMRMGSYGVLDPMAAAMRPGAGHGAH